MFAHLDPARYERRAVQLLADRTVRVLPPDTAPDAAAWPAAAPQSLLDAFRALVAWRMDVAALALHGAGGEDGAMQGFLETMGVPYTHSGVTGSAVSMDKEISKFLYDAHAIATPRHVTVRPGDDPVARAEQAGLGWPVVVKPPCLGSSFEVHIAHDAAALRAAAAALLRIDDRALVETFIRGREFTCAALQRRFAGPVEALPVTEIVPVTGTFFDHQAKYTPGATRELTPAPIDDDLARRIQEAAVRCHAALHCACVSRTDFMLDAAGMLFALETNAIPGMTETSLLPQAADKAGLSFAALLDLMLEFAIARAAHARPAP
jgi:D-alanine-D-alanine ligase